VRESAIYSKAAKESRADWRRLREGVFCKAEGSHARYNEITNYAIGAAADYLGRRRIGYAGYLKWLGRRIPFRTRSLEKIGFEFFEPPAQPR
jgi:hypothetical protein